MTDATALVVFLLIAGGFSWIMDYSPLRARTLNAAIDAQRRAWMRVLATRDLRMVDTQIVASQLQGAGFFASTCLLGIGAAFTLATAGDPVLEVLQSVRFNEALTMAELQTRVVGLFLIYAYAFFKFGWAYRLFNYTAVLIGSAPYGETAPERERHVERLAAVNIAAGAQFNRGLRALFFSIGYLGGFAGPWSLAACTALIATVLTYRQFASPAARALRDLPSADG